MKANKKEYITPVAELLSLGTVAMLSLSTDEGGIDTDSGSGDDDGDSGGWSKEQAGGSWNDIWGGM